MISPPSSDFWQVGIVPAPITDLLNTPLTAKSDWTYQMTWLPDPGPWRYLADPFGLRRGDTTHVFVEAFDYRNKHGVIEHHEFGPHLDWRGKSVVLSRPFHLSYPYLIEDGGEVFMIPECHRAGEIMLYRARDFPRQWVRETTLLSGVAGAEASVIKHEGRWWMFYTIVGPHARDQRELHVAFADRLTGPWQSHPLNPVVDDLSGGRPGGTPFVGPEGQLILPVQNCRDTYGGALRFLAFTQLSPDRIDIRQIGPELTGDIFSNTHRQGCHTLSRCGDYTLVDTKRIVHTWSRHRINLQRHLARLRLDLPKRSLRSA